MALRALRECAHVGCRELTRETRCERHKKERGRGTSRNRPGDPFYSSRAWRRKRAAKLARDPLCEECLARGLTKGAEHVDHTLDRRDRPDLAFADENLRSLCESCHNRKTARTMARRRRERKTTEGSEPPAGQGREQGERRPEGAAASEFQTSSERYRGKAGAQTETDGDALDGGRPASGPPQGAGQEPEAEGGADPA